MGKFRNEFPTEIHDEIDARLVALLDMIGPNLRDRPRLIISQGRKIVSAQVFVLPRDPKFGEIDRHGWVSLDAIVNELGKEGESRGGMYQVWGVNMSEDGGVRKGRPSPMEQPHAG
jgi:hypothetical protein